MKDEEVVSISVCLVWRGFDGTKAGSTAGGSLLLSAKQRERKTPTLMVDFEKWDVSSSRNGLYIINVVRGMLEGEDFQALDTLISFVVALVD